MKKAAVDIQMQGLRKCIYFMYMSIRLQECMCTTCVLGTYGGERVLDPVIVELQAVEDAMWALRSDLCPLQEQPMLLTAESPLQPYAEGFMWTLCFS